jgi:hypothetical protein
MAEERDDFDNPWKVLMDKYFQQFLAFFFPEIHGDIDWSKGYEFLDKEFQQIVRDAESGKRYVDKLVKVWVRDGQAQIVYIHTELQSQEDSRFSQRIFVYNYRIRDYYGENVVSLAILGDDRSTWRPTTYRSDRWGFEVTCTFPMVKLLDYEANWEMLESSQNPFAIAVMAHLKTRETQQDPQSRKEWKFRLTRQLYEGGWERQDIMELFAFLDWLMELPQPLKQEFKAELQQYEQERQMRYVTSIERMIIEEVKEEAVEEIALTMLAKQVAVETVAEYTGLSIEKVQELAARRLDSV